MFLMCTQQRSAHSLKSETAATCEKDGKKEYVCECGDSYSEAAKATGHSYSAATCTKPKSCSICNKTDGSALGHSLVNCVCSRCRAIILTVNDLQGSWISTWSNPGAYRKITFSGSSYCLEYYCEMQEYGYTDLNIYTGTFSVNGNVITICATATNTRTTSEGTETKTFAYNVEETIIEYTPNMFVFDGLGTFYRQ